MSTNVQYLINTKNLVLTLFFALGSLQIQAQSCSELKAMIKQQYQGTTYNSYTSTAISKVTFYTATIDYQNYYFAIVCFKQKYSYGCTEYIYQVNSDTKVKYSLEYLNSAGDAFWKYIQPYSDVLGCSPD